MSLKSTGTMFLQSSLGRAARAMCAETLITTGIIDGIFGRRVFSAYDYMFSPRQLIFFTQCLSEVRNVPGCCVEVGCAYGQTTAFLRKFMDESGITKYYYAIDTFRGFVPGHVDYEVQQRSKSRHGIAVSFVTNKKKWFDKSLKVAGINSVSSIECDATKFDFDHVGPIAFALLDVDLYQPIIDILPKLFRNLSAGGILLIDDCKPHELWDGALVAYREFASRMNFEPKIVLDKIGVITKS